MIGDIGIISLLRNLGKQGFYMLMNIAPSWGQSRGNSDLKTKVGRRSSENAFKIGRRGGSQGCSFE
ncbi:hypothetical protein Fmac_028984 [Flemingia macrophylla]|uniref:Uncharacterized protein n=1 Tax=Flemingia macrophylla TaxID=520843 RepID=A0ABD1LAI8_9FABA